MRTYLSSYLSKLFAGDLAALGGPATDEAVAAHIRAEQISLVLGYSLGISWPTPAMRLCLRLLSGTRPTETMP